MKLATFIACLLILLIASCSKFEEKATSLTVEKVKDAIFLANGEEAQFKLTNMGEEKFTLEVVNKNGQMKSFDLESNPSESTEIHEHFYAKLCNQDVLIVVVRQWINTHESGDWFNYNVVINIENGTLIKILEVNESETKIKSEILLEGQQQVIAKLKSGKRSDSVCRALMPILFPSKSSNKTRNPVFLSYGEEANLDLISADKDFIILDIANKNGQIRSVNLELPLFLPPQIHEHFYTKFCNQDALVAVVRYEVNSDNSKGWIYWNVVINANEGTLMKILEKNEIKDLVENKPASDEQKQAIAMLKSRLMCDKP